MRQSSAFQPEFHSNGMQCRQHTKQQDIAFNAMGNINNRNSTEHGMKFQTAAAAAAAASQHSMDEVNLNVV